METRKEFFSRMRYALHRLSRSEALLFFALALLLAGTVAWGLLQIQDRYSTTIAAHGGHLREGSIGVPRFVNPLLAVTDADKDLVALVYSGLVRHDSNGELIPDLAESYEVSEDGLIYTFRIRDNATFHDGSNVTAEDIAFTISRAVSPDLKSPKRAAWEGVTVETPDTRTVVFHLRQAYPRFLENATLGILPKHLWEPLSDEAFPHSVLNTEPIGTGPYEIGRVIRSEAGIPSAYELQAFSDFSLGEAYISDITLSYHQNNESLKAALEHKDIDTAHGLSIADAKSINRPGVSIETAPLPRMFGIFFNQTKIPALADDDVRKAIDEAIDRNKLINDAYFGFADARYTPLPINTAHEGSIASANARLDEAGWEMKDGVRQKTIDKKINFLQMSLIVPDSADLLKVAESVVSQLKEIGMQVDITVVDQSSIATVIRPREFQAILFGQAVGWNADLYAFWHSSQRIDPGLNIAGYTNLNADKALVRARGARDKEEILGYHESFLKEFDADTPAVFLFSPRFVYIVADTVQGVELGQISSPSDRFSMVHTWYIATDSVWNVFTD
jgi:peptide/nickel transport system substrate-binding protein